jgi:hypothetical protein
MNVSSYFHQIKHQIEQASWMISEESISMLSDDIAHTGFIEGILTFIDNSILDYSIIISQQGIKYRFQYMTETKSLIIRWDNTPHHKDVKTFPYHIHTSDGKVLESQPVDIAEVLKKIKQIISSRL